MRDLGVWLRQQRLSRHWPAAKMARELLGAAKSRGDNTLPSAAIMTAYVLRWERGVVAPTERYRLFYCTVLGISPDEFGPDLESGPARSARKMPNHTLRNIREHERHETRYEFAEAMAHVARELGEDVYPDEKYVERLESGAISWPRPPYRKVLSKLCGRPIGDLGFTAPALSMSLTAASAERDSDGIAPMRVNVPLRDAILATGMEISQLAHNVGVDPKTAQRWITQGRIPHPRHRWKTCQILGAKESELWPGAIPGKGNQKINSITLSKPEGADGNVLSDFPDSLDASFTADMVETMKRRAFLMGVATAAGFGAVGGITARETIRHELGLSMAHNHSAVDVEEWREIAAEYGETYPVAEPAELLKALMVDLYGLQASMQATPGESRRRELRGIGAMLSAFTAQTIANLGNLYEARRWWRTARQAADESEDSYIVLWIRGREIVRAGYEHRPHSSIVRLIEEAESRVTGRPSQTTAMPEFLSGKAQTLALYGQSASEDAETALNRLREAYGALPTSTRTGTDSIFSWGEERLRFTESLTYTYLGDYRKADKAQSSALVLYPKDDLRSPAQIELQRAMCLIGAGDVLTGVRHAQKVISELPAMHRIRPVADLGHKVLRAVPVQSKADDSVREYDACLNATFTVVPELTS